MYSERLVAKRSKNYGKGDVSKITDDSKEDDKHTTINGNNNFENKIIIDVNYVMSRYRFIFPES